MNFMLQLRLLIWKNFILRRRSWIRLLIEILWPLFLFLILVLVRLRGLRKYHHQCYFDEKAMPSAGLVNFAQSFICTFNNTCHLENRQDFTQTQTYNDSFISQVVQDVEFALERNFNQERVDAVSEIIKDLYLIQQMGIKVGKSFRNEEGIPGSGLGLTVDKVSELLKDPNAFLFSLLSWSNTKNIPLEPNVIRGLLDSTLRPENVSPTELVNMITDPRTALCDPELVSRLIDAKNMTYEEVTESLKPFCNLSVEDALELLELVQENIDWKQVQNELDEFAVGNGKGELNFSDWKKLISIGEDVRRDLLEKDSIKMVIGDVSDFMKKLTDQMTREVSNETLSTNSLFTRNISESGRLAFAAFQRVVCGRNMSSDQLFSDGGAATRFDQLRDQLKEKDEEIFYLYDNSTSVECNAFMKTMEENRLTGFLWDQMKPFIRGKILFTPDTPATRKLMSLVNATFSPIEDVRRLTEMWIDTYSDRVRGFFLDKENQEFLKEQFTSEEPGSLLDRLLNNNITIALNQEGATELVDGEKLKLTLQEYFSGNYSERWENTFDTIDRVAQNVSTYLSCFDFNKFVGFNAELEMEKEGINLISENKLWAGIVFPDFPISTDSEKFPKFIKYKIRMDSDKVDTTRYIEDRLARPGPRRRPGIDLKYLYFGFGYLQDMVEHSIIAVQSGRNKSGLPGITLQQMPYPCYIEDRFVIAIARTFPLFMTLAWVYSASMIIKSIVYEKEKRLKETMRVMGMGNGVHWLSWFVDSFIIMAFSACLLTIILKYGDILSKSDPSVILAFMLSYTISTIMLCFFISTLFSRANVAAAAGGIIFFCFYLPYSFMVVWEEFLNPNFKIASCLVSNIAFGFGCAYFSHYEESGIGAQWDNIWTSPLLEDRFSMGGAMLMLLLDSVIYGVLSWYTEAVFPGQYGVPKPWYFFLTKTYWIESPLSSLNDTSSLNGSLSEVEMGEHAKNIEVEPKHLPLGVGVKHLSKVYSNGKVAVEDLSLNFYEGQITSFLGHNGAGKTTTISILTGLFPPSAGSAFIYGLDIRKDMDRIRRSLGTCPQHNVLFDHLTVFEHLWFYARLKGRDPEDIYREADNMIKDLALPHKRDELSVNLSGGMQRKLSIASAFVGGSKVVVLDEPTAGVDPYSRRAIWDLLIKYKENRTIILTTHFMDEADLLGDRIAIINNGKLICFGSSLFLRARFGNGYYLTLVRDDSTEDDDEKAEPLLEEEELDIDGDHDEISSGEDENDAVDHILGDVDDLSVQVNDVKKRRKPNPSSGSESINDIIIDDEGVSDIHRTNGIVINPSRVNEYALNYPHTKFIQKWVPNARLLEQIGSEIIYILPTNDPRVVKKFDRLFTELDRYMSKLKIKSYGLSDTTLEEIFLKVASNGNDGEIVRHLDEGSTNVGMVANRVRSASESSGIRHFFSSKKKPLSEANPNSPNSAIPLKKILVSGDNKLIRYESVSQSDEPKDQPPKPKLQNPVKPPEDESVTSMFWKHLKALQIKRFHHSKRNKKGMLCEVVLPAAFVCLAMLFTLVLPPLEEQNPLEIHPWIYPSSGEYSLNTFYSNSHRGGDWPRRYESQLLSKTGMGIKCLKTNTMEGFQTCLDSAPQTANFSYAEGVLEGMPLKECSCAIGTQRCPRNAAGVEPPTVVMPSFDILYNLTGRNVSDYLMKTRGESYKRRYGGFEFGIRNPLANRNFTQLEEITDRWLSATNNGKSRLDPVIRDILFGNLEDLALSSSQFDNIRVWFNNKGWAASVAYMNSVNNIVLRASIEAQRESLDLDFNTEFKDASEYGMAVINHPMNFTKEQLDTEIIRQIGISLLHAICVIFAMSFVPASFVIFHIDERVNKVKHLQFVSGVRPITYWISAFLWDMAMFIFSASLCVLIFLAFDAQAYVSPENFPSLLIIMLLYGFSSIPLMYPASFLFSVPSSAFVTLSCTNLFIGIITTVTTFVLENFEDDELQYIGSILREVFLIFPQYCLGRGLMDMATEMNINLIVQKFGYISVRNRFAWNFLGKYMICMTLQGVLLFGLVLIIEYRLWSWIPRLLRKTEECDDFDADDEDEDVIKERLRVLSKNNPHDVLAVKSLLKRYTKNAKPAVNRLTFGVRKGECFGLLGVNGAGKTTTFKMLTGDANPSGGDAWVNGNSILTQLQKVRKSLGYCPQFDALNPLLTGREHLRLYARLRGLDEESVKKVADWGLKKLGLVAYSDRCAGTYSGGNKRKLSTAIALVGNPSIVFLDEPTTGMDPGARRFLWNTILEMIRGGQSVVLTSHSMEECEALCTRLGIMVNGQFQCLGSAQHLKNRFGSGYTLTLRSNGESEAIPYLKDLVSKTFPLAELREEHYNQVQYQLPLKHTKLPVVFREMEEAKAKPKESYLEDYSITQTTLDEVFIRFASKQTEMMEDIAANEAMNDESHHLGEVKA